MTPWGAMWRGFVTMLAVVAILALVFTIWAINSGTQFPF